jgi:hypothetical protein
LEELIEHRVAVHSLLHDSYWISSTRPLPCTIRLLQCTGSLHELAKRDGVSRRHIRRLVNLTFLSPELVEAILRAGNPSIDADGQIRRHLERNRKFADSPPEGNGFELVWGFSCQVVFFGLLPVLCSERKGPFFIPSPTIRFPERAQWGQGTETLAKLGALPPSGACVWQRLDA